MSYLAHSLRIRKNGRRNRPLDSGPPQPERGQSKPRGAIFLVPLLLAVLSTAASAAAQLQKARPSGTQASDLRLPDAPSAIAPLKRYSFSLGLDTKYSLTNSLYEITPRVAINVRVGERETIGLSFSHPTVMNDQHAQSNSVSVSTNFRLFSWGRIPR